MTATFGDGQPRDPKATEKRITDIWIPRFKDGHPHGGLTIFGFDQETPAPIGHVVAGTGDDAGASEIAYTLMEADFPPNSKENPRIWGKGIMSSVVRTVVTEWAPEVGRIGRDQSLGLISERFRCFGGQPLERLDATANPSNIGSWKVLSSNGFLPAKTRLVSPHPIADFDGKDIPPGDMKDALLPLFSTQSEKPLEKGKRYHVIGEDGKIWTVSYHERFNCLKSHWEFPLSATSDSN